VTTLVQEYVPGQSGGTTSNDSPAAVKSIFLRSDIEVVVVENANPEVVIAELRKKFLEKARETNPNAQLIPDRLPSTIGQPQETQLADGYKSVKVLMEGYVASQ
jgi:hypothetical protein